MMLITGSMGFLGSTVAQLVPYALATLGRDHRDLRIYTQIVDWIEWYRPEVVIHCAYPGTDGIGTMLSTPADLVRDMLQIDLNVIDACAKAKVKKLICMGSLCAYPEAVTCPTGEDQLWAGYPETTNAAYGIAKRMQLELLRSYRQQYGLNGLHLILGNLYGPGDRSGHVIPTTIRKILKAKAEGATEIEVWGDGTATREFLYVEDAARAIVVAVDRYDSPEPLNIVSGHEIGIRQLVEDIGRIVGWTGSIRWDTSKPNGQPRRWFSRDLAKIALGWTPTVSFTDGLTQTIAWMQHEEKRS